MLMFSLWNPHSKVLRSSAGWIIDIQFSRKLQILSRLVRCIQEEASVVNIARPAADMVLGAIMQSHPAGLWGR
ncbi:uncharacterized protein CLUP02_18346 [Colletotrichum lupini]|uniref:Uncharacterized protein n=1 Tax=Colletotrichum lupini TaxID=145971 RepID=A0A9Q8SG82_9PEZI|nr:uncharacterized protein CLUP02_18346 [Colletotrichum lupini]UQC76831.1 hypothetical protein CLUP02_18346 [Colletotrichum lupini]